MDPARRSVMKLRLSIGLAMFVAAGLSLSTSSASAFAGHERPLYQIQYDRYQDRDDRYNDRDRDRYEDRDFRHPAKWRPGEVLPPPLLERVVGDWEDRGLMRPPGGHEWVRVREQFILVRVRDRMISRVINFD